MRQLKRHGERGPLKQNGALKIDSGAPRLDP
jgi:hypothetical protein